MSVRRILTAANGGVPAGDYRPLNCHEAAVAWVLQHDLDQCQPHASGQCETAWATVRQLANSHCSGGITPQFTGSFVGSTLYQGKTALTRATLGNLNLGDIIAFGASQAPGHSTVVVQIDTTGVFVRGFNNAGCFGVPDFHGAPMAQYMAYDTTLRNLDRAAAWTGGNQWKTHTGNLDVWRVPVATVLANIP